MASTIENAPSAPQAIKTRLPKLLPEQRQYLIRAVVLAIVIRLAFVGLAYLVDRIIMQHTHPAWDKMLWDTYRHWDAHHYQQLADLGYRNTPEDKYLLVFFPLLPFLIKTLNMFIGHYLFSGLIISFVATVALGFFLQDLLRLEGYDQDFIWRSFLFCSFFPTAVYAMFPYTEALFLALVLMAFWFGRQARWSWAAICGALACATRSTGIWLLPALLLEAWLLDRQRIWRAGWLLLIPSGLLVYLYFNWQVLGDPLAFVALQREHWNQHPVSPWGQLMFVWERLQNETNLKTRFTYYELRLWSMLFGTGLLLLGLRKLNRLRWSWQVYAWGSWLMFMSVLEAMSIPRYFYVLFPLYVVLAQLTRNPLAFQATLGASTILMSIWFILYTTGQGGY